MQKELRMELHERVGGRREVSKSRLVSQPFTVNSPPQRERTSPLRYMNKEETRRGKMGEAHRNKTGKESKNTP